MHLPIITPSLPFRVSQDLFQHLASSYCDTLAAQFSHLTSPEQQQWWIERMESPRFISGTHKRGILHTLLVAAKFENFLATKYAPSPPPLPSPNLVLAHIVDEAHRCPNALP